MDESIQFKTYQDAIRARHINSCNALLSRLVKHHGIPAPQPKPDIVEIVPIVVAPPPEAKADAVVPTWFAMFEPRCTDYPSIKDIRAAVCKHYNLSLADMLSSRRTANIVRPRQVAIYLCKEFTPLSLMQIGRKFGGKDHTTVLHASRVIPERARTDAKLAQDIAILTEAITGVQQ